MYRMISTGVYKENSQIGQEQFFSAHPQASPRPTTSLVFSSFRRKPESSRSKGFAPLLWIPAFAGMTVFW